LAETAADVRTSVALFARDDIVLMSQNRLAEFFTPRIRTSSNSLEACWMTRFYSPIQL